MGVTVMIGQNDIAGERFNVADAQALVTFANGQGMARLSEWSLNRDTQCGADFAQIGVLSNTCSGVAQERPLQFTEVFGQVSGDAAVAAGVVTTPDPLTTPAPAVTQDDPATSPYPIWRPRGMYRAGYKVVWRGEVYVPSGTRRTSPTPPDSSAGRPPGSWSGRCCPATVRSASPPQPAGTYPAWTSTGSYPGHQGALPGPALPAREVLHQQLDPRRVPDQLVEVGVDPALPAPPESRTDPLTLTPGMGRAVGSRGVRNPDPGGGRGPARPRARRRSQRPHPGGRRADRRRPADRAHRAAPRRPRRAAAAGVPRPRLRHAHAQRGHPHRPARSPGRSAAACPGACSRWRSPRCSRSPAAPGSRAFSGWGPRAPARGAAGGEGSAAIAFPIIVERQVTGQTVSLLMGWLAVAKLDHGGGDADHPGRVGRVGPGARR